MKFILQRNIVTKAVLLFCYLILAIFFTFADPPKFVYRADTRPPSEIFKHGFKSYGVNDSLIKHISGSTIYLSNQDFTAADGSLFISTAGDIASVRGFIRNNRDFNRNKPVYIYEIRADNNFYSLMNSLHYAANDPQIPITNRSTASTLASQFDNENEYLALGAIPANQIRRVFPVRFDSDLASQLIDGSPQLNSAYRDIDTQANSGILPLRGSRCKAEDNGNQSGNSSAVCVMPESIYLQPNPSANCFSTITSWLGIQSGNSIYALRSDRSSISATALSGSTNISSSKPISVKMSELYKINMCSSMDYCDSQYINTCLGKLTTIAPDRNNRNIANLIFANGQVKQYDLIKNQELNSALIPITTLWSIDKKFANKNVISVVSHPLDNNKTWIIMNDMYNVILYDHRSNHASYHKIPDIWSNMPDFDKKSLSLIYSKKYYYDDKYEYVFIRNNNQIYGYEAGNGLLAPNNLKYTVTVSNYFGISDEDARNLTNVFKYSPDSDYIYLLFKTIGNKIAKYSVFSYSEKRILFGYPKSITYLLDDLKSKEK